jgi:hypothetical protein
MLFHDENPAQFPQQWGDYIISYRSENDEVLFHVFMKDNRTKAHIRFAEGIDFANVEDPVYMEANDHLVQEGYPKISSYDRMT